MIELDVSAPAPFRIAVISTSDVARGPAIHHVLRAHLRLTEMDARTVIASSGTFAVQGAPVDPQMAGLLHELRVVDAAELHALHCAHRLSERRLAQADLVLCASRDDRRRAVELRPQVRARAFTLVEFARLVAALPETLEDPRRLVRQAASLRAAVRPVDPAEDDPHDPGVEVDPDYQPVLRRIEHACGDVASGITRTLVAAGAHRA